MPPESNSEPLVPLQRMNCLSEPPTYVLLTQSAMENESSPNSTAGLSGTVR